MPDRIPVECSECGRGCWATRHRSGGLRVRNHRRWDTEVHCVGAQRYDHKPLEDPDHAA